uniref:ORF4a protein n=1 Tax=Middle East respiratory syndrome-related coronavirus TaxID=1335626 RepID=A0A2I6PIX1_MERS|nr:ORF4a protein [Middle East respiratory syndrome-related coronavirus]
MDYVSLLNEVWQKYTNSASTSLDWFPRPYIAYKPVPGTSTHPVQWECTFTFAGFVGQAVNSSKALAKQDAARQVAWELHREGKLNGFKLRWCHPF